MEIAALEGQLMATQAAVRMLIAGHPESRAMARAVNTEVERLIAAALPTTNEEAFLDGVERARRNFLPTALLRDD